MGVPILRVNELGRELTYQAAYDFFMNLEKNEKNFENLERKEIEKYQTMMIEKVCRHASDNNNYYHEMLSLTDAPVVLSSLPLLKKEAIRGDKELIKCCDDRFVGQIHLTSGTTGIPTYIAYTLADQYIYELLPQYSMLFPYGPEDTIGISLPYEFALPALGFQRLFQFAFGATCLSLGKGGYMAPVDKILELLSVYKPTVIATIPSYAALLYEEAQKYNYDVRDFGIKSFILTGEGCSYTYRNRLEKMWNTKMYFFYGSTEIGLIGKECEKQQGYHIGEGHVAVEIIDENNNLLPDGEVGEIIVTTLLREGMPMIRYKTEDRGYIVNSKCDCGCNMKKLYLLGRERDQLHIGEIAISPFALENILIKSERVSLWYQFHLKDNHLLIRCEKLNYQDDDEVVIKDVKDLIKEHIDVDCDVEICDDIPRNLGKNQRVFKL